MHYDTGRRLITYTDACYILCAFCATSTILGRSIAVRITRLIGVLSFNKPFYMQGGLSGYFIWGHLILAPDGA